MVLVAWELAGQTYFNINDFPAALEHLSTLGSTIVEDKSLVLTKEDKNRVGACWYKSEELNVINGFDTHFSFRIVNQEGNPGDGFAFVMQNQSPIVMGKPGSGLGYENIKGGIALEFDTKDDQEGSKNHVAISIYDHEVGDYKSIATVHAISEITDGVVHFTKIEYREGRLTVFLDAYLFPILSLKIDLEEYFKGSKGNVWMGFTSSTSTSASKHELIEWKTNSLAEEPENVAVERIDIDYSDTLVVSSRNIQLQLWDGNKIDGDKVSVQLNEDWILTDYVLKKEPHVLDLTLTGFESRLTLFAQNLGANPPNTATFLVDDGEQQHLIELNADFERSEAILIRCTPD